MSNEMDLITQTFSATEEDYDTEPVVNLPDPMEPRPTPGFFRRASHKAPKGSVPLFELDEVPARGEYDHG